MKYNFRELTASISACQICAEDLSHEPSPIFQLNPKARILIAGQAPVRKAHESGIPFDDPSGDRLRDWMGITKEIFYDASKIAILPMSFCYPGHGRTGDLPPRRECARHGGNRPCKLCQILSANSSLVVMPSNGILMYQRKQA